jgi:hypothetical protein
LQVKRRAKQHAHTRLLKTHNITRDKNNMRLAKL